MATKKKTTHAPSAPAMSKEEQIGFHKGAVDTLLKERQEMVKIVTVVDQLLKAHVTALHHLGVKITQQKSKSLEKSLK